ncbi:M23 family metallopeptidase [Desulfothermus okinawensis JCM 13304]
MLYSVIFCLVLFLSNGFATTINPGSKGSIKVSIPTKVVVGDPFEIQVYNRSSRQNINIYWLGRNIYLTLPGSRKLNIFLGSDIKKDKPGVKLIKITYGNKKIRKKIYLEKRKLSITRIHVAKKFSYLTKKDLTRYYREKRIIESILQRVTKKRYFVPDFVPPIIPFKISSPYGRIRIINNKNQSIHTGIDIKAREGTPVKAINSGYVALVINQFFSGKSIYIDHGDGIVSMYFHLKKILVKKGQIVKKGQVIALSGKTGRVSGPHLHLGVSIFGRLVDPEKLIKKF